MVIRVIDWDAYKERVCARGMTRRDRIIDAARKRIEDISVDSPSYQQCTVNNTTSINLLIMGSDDLNKKKFKVMPSDAQYMHYGTVVEWNNAFWLVTELDFDDTVTKGGYMKFCNIELHFQVGDDSTIYKRWGVFDKGVYSTNIAETNVGQTGHLQRMIYLPLDDKTQFLHRDKRIATNKIPFPDGHYELQCYKILSADPIADSSNDGQLLTLAVGEGLFMPDADNVDEMVCDYVAPPPPLDPDAPEDDDDDNASDEGGGWV